MRAACANTRPFFPPGFALQKNPIVNTFARRCPHTLLVGWPAVRWLKMLSPNDTHCEECDCADCTPAKRTKPVRCGKLQPAYGCLIELVGLIGEGWAM